LRIKNINPYKIGIYFYILLILSVISLLGCKTLGRYYEEVTIKQQAKEILNSPKLI